MELTSASLAAIFAATIGGLVSLLGLIISKEQSVSQFRQAWIDALRGEIASAVSYISDGVARLRQFDRDPSERVLDDDYVRGLHEKLCLIRLRLNPKDIPAPEILTLLKRIEDALTWGELDTSEEFFDQGMDKVRADVERVVELSQSLLKNEWTRVKTGEPFYKYSRRGIAVVLILFVGILTWATFSGIEVKEAPSLAASVEK